MTRPTVSVTAERLYEALGPMQEHDDEHGWALLHLCDALTVSAAEVEALAADTDTQVGWQPLLDVTTAPLKALPYLAMFVGAVVTPALSEAQARDLIRSAPGQRRGTVEAIKDAARLWLTGSKVVTVTERPGGDAYAFEVTVYAAQAVDVGQLTAAIQAAKPAGLNMTLTVISGRTVAEFEADFPVGTVADVETFYSGLTVHDAEIEVP